MKGRVPDGVCVCLDGVGGDLSILDACGDMEVPGRLRDAARLCAEEI